MEKAKIYKMTNLVFISDKQLANEIIGRINARDYTQQSAFMVNGANQKITGILYGFSMMQTTASDIMKSLKTPDYVTYCLNRNVDDYKIEKVNVMTKNNKTYSTLVVPMIFID
jgi:hypothetical protein